MWVNIITGFVALSLLSMLTLALVKQRVRRYLLEQEYKKGYKYGLSDLFKTSDTDEYNQGWEDGQRERKKGIVRMHRSGPKDLS